MCVCVWNSSDPKDKFSFYAFIINKFVGVVHVFVLHCTCTGICKMIKPSLFSVHIKSVSAHSPMSGLDKL